MIEPWVGAEYRKTGLLLLGESFYLGEKDGVLVDHGPRHILHVVEERFDNPHLFRGFIATVSRGICGVEKPSPTHLREAWSRVAFTNYVAPRSAAAPGRGRPNPNGRPPRRSSPAYWSA